MHVFLRFLSLSITLLRIPLMLLFLYLSASYSLTFKVSLIAIILGIILSDYFDGYLADRYNFESPNRRLIDGIVDRIVINGVFLGTVLFCNLPIFYYIPFLIREVLLIGGGMIAARSFRRVIYANILPKTVNLSVAAAGMAFIIGGLSNLSALLFVLSYILIFLGIIDYAGILFGIIKRGCYFQKDWEIYYPDRFEGIVQLIEILRKRTTSAFILKQ